MLQNRVDWLSRKALFWKMVNKCYGQSANKMVHKFYKYCIVPQCKSSTIKTPKKLFISVPRKEQIRKKWLRLARRDENVALESRMYFCEDHFDLPKDMENYMVYHVMGFVTQIRMKPNTLPSKFDCQSAKRTKQTGTGRLKEQLGPKKQRMSIIDECLNESVEIGTTLVQGETSVTSPGT